MSNREQRRPRNFQQSNTNFEANAIAEELRARLERDDAPRTLPLTLPGCSLTADGQFIPEEERTPQTFADGVYIAVCNVVVRELQKYNTCNRKKSRANVDRLLTAMKCGEWRYNGKSSVLVCSNTAVLDSQHTFEAIKEYFENTPTDHVKTPILMRVEMGLPPSVFSTYDNGARRTLADTLHVEAATGNVDYGSVPDNVMSQSQRLFLQYLNNLYDLDENDINFLPNERAGLINSRAAKILNMYPGLVKSAAFVCSVKGIRAVVRQFIVIVAHMLISEAQSETAANNFVRALATGADLPANSPILALRSLYMKTTERTRRMEGPEALAYFLHAWNKFAAGQEVAPGRLKSFGAEGKIPVPQRISRQRTLA